LGNNTSKAQNGRFSKYMFLLQGVAGGKQTNPRKTNLANNRNDKNLKKSKYF